MPPRGRQAGQPGDHLLRTTPRRRVHDRRLSDRRARPLDGTDRVRRSSFVLGADAQHFPDRDRLERLIRDRVDSGLGVGIVIGVLEADGTRRTAAYGTAGPGAKPLTEKSVVEIGSITKAFTGTLLADMAARGELGVDDPAQAHAPEGMRLPARGETQITLLDLRRYVGLYEMTPAFRIEVTEQDGRIYIRATNQPRFEIVAQSETEFFVRAFEARIAFIIENGESTALILRQGGVEQRARKRR